MTYSSLTILRTTSLFKIEAHCLDVEFNEMIPPMTVTLKLLSTFNKIPRLLFPSLSKQD